MDITLKIDKKSETPVYRQIIEQITLLVQNGTLPSGSRLPPERELAERLGIARGTIKKAYEKLAGNKVLDMVQGRGSFISSEQDVMNEGRKEQAVKMIVRTIIALEKLKFSHREISSLFHILIMEREKRLESFHIAAIDCNPEALSIFERQLRHVSNVRLYKFLLDNISRDPDCKRKLQEFDLLLTTSTHYPELLGLVPELREKIIQAVVSPSQQTIIDMAKIPANAQIGVITRSKNFLNIIRSKLKEFQLNLKNITQLFEDNPVDFAEFLNSRSVLITPPECDLENRKEYMAAFQRFREKGGVIIRFEYQIERSALIQIESRISQQMSQVQSVPFM